MVLGRVRRMPLALALVLARLVAVAPRPQEPPWAPWRWLATVDLRVLGTTLAAALLLGLWGAWVGWRGPRASSDETRE